MSKHWVLCKPTWLFFIIEINKILINILVLSLRPWHRYNNIWICKFGGLFFLNLWPQSLSVCLLSQVSIRTKAKLFNLAKSIGYSHIYWTLAKNSFGTNKKQSYNKGLFFKKTRVLKFTVLLCNSCFTCLQHCVGGGKKSRHSEQNVKSREIFRQQ